MSDLMWLKTLVHYNQTSPLRPNSTLPPLYAHCFTDQISNHIVGAFTAASLLFLTPLLLLVLCPGLKQWRRRRSEPAALREHHPDPFTANMSAMGLIEVLAAVLYSAGGYSGWEDLADSGFALFCVTWSVKLQFHALTCVERYMAVVHPVAYLRRTDRGRGRSAAALAVWLLLAAQLVCIQLATLTVNLALFFVLAAGALVVVCFCSVSVLHALRYPGPGDGSGHGALRLSRAKRRAFLSILVILVCVLLALGWTVILNVVNIFLDLFQRGGCVFFGLMPWFCLPGTAVLPLLHLHRTRRPPASGAGSNTV